MDATRDMERLHTCVMLSDPILVRQGCGIFLPTSQAWRLRRRFPFVRQTFCALAVRASRRSASFIL